MKYLTSYNKFIEKQTLYYNIGISDNDWSILLEKSELKYSNSAFDQISKLLTEYKKKKNILKSDEKVYKEMGFEDGIKIKIPYNEICYDSKDIKIGLFLVAVELSAKVVNNEYIFTDEQINNYKQIFKDIKENKSNKLFDETYKKVLNEGFEVINLDISGSSGGDAIGSANWYYKTLTINQELLYRLIVSDSEMQSTIRHELQHFTQFINSYLIILAKEFYKRVNQLLDSETKDKPFFTREKSSFFFDKYKDEKERFQYLFFHLMKISWGNSVMGKKSAGQSKTKSGLKQSFTTDKGFWKNLNQQLSFALTQLTGISTKPGIEYFGDDMEYHTWISDTIDQYTKKYKDYIEKNDITTATNYIFNKVKSTPQFKINFKLKKETSKDYYLNLRNRIEKIKND